MPSPYHSNQPPFTLPSNIIYFHDWRYVFHGSTGAWVDDKGEGRGLFTQDDVPPMRYAHHDMPLGIELVAKKAVKHGPVLDAPESAILLMGGTLIHEQGRYRLWYECWPGEQIGEPTMGIRNIVRYAESDDGVNWTQPDLGLCEYQGSQSNNVVISPAITGEIGHHGGSVFVDPNAEPEARYKSVFLGRPSEAMFEQCRQERPDQIDPHSGKGGYALFGATSPDGLRWTVQPKPLVIQNSDTHNVGEYDPLLGKYVIYCRSWFFMRRTIGRTESDNFKQFPLPEELIWPGPATKPYELWYANGKTVMPGAPDYHVMFPLQWSLVDDHFEFHLATSPDNMTWNFVPGGPVCGVGEPDEYDGGVVWPGVGLVDLPGQRTGMLFQAAPVPHKHPRRPPFGHLGLASWPKGRLVALQAAEEGSFRTFAVKAQGRQVRLNFQTAPAGFVKVEVADEQGQPLEGRTLEDCDRLSGDHLDRVVTWKGQNDLGHAEDAPVVLRFHLRRAELYSVAFE